MINYIFFIIIGYLSGSIMYAHLLPHMTKHIDIRKFSEDGNPGAANVFMHAGIPMGVLVLICELLKGALPVWFAARNTDISSLLFAFVMAAPVLGHAFPLFWMFKNGGKSIAVSFGVLLGLYPNLTPVYILAALYILFSLVIVIRPHFFRSVITFLVFTFCCLFIKSLPVSISLGCLALSLTVILKHYFRYQGEQIRFKFLYKRLIKDR